MEIDSQVAGGEDGFASADVAVRSRGGGASLRSASALLTRSWSFIALLSVLGVSGFVNVWHLTRNGYGNTYYAAAVRSMSESWHNFFFASFDPGGFVTVDKPPVGLWIETAFVKVFGYSGLNLLLPEAIAGVATVLIVYLGVSRVFGRGAGLIGALVTALTPISVAVNRSNNLDAWLVFFVAAAAYAVIRAIESHGLRWLVASAVLMGVAFNTKLLAAYVALPALWFAYLVTAPVPWRRRVIELSAATAVLAVVSGAWVVAVDLTPAASRPYVGGSKTNSELNLLIDYNGLGRIDGTEVGPGAARNRPPGVADAQRPSDAAPPLPGGAIPGGGAGPQGYAPLPAAPDDRPFAPNGGPGGPGGGPFGGGETGPLRLFQGGLAGQASWLIPLALIGGLAALVSAGTRLRGNRRLGGIIVWGGWLLTAGLVFSGARGIFHPYYLSFLGPALGAMVGIGIVSFAGHVGARSRLALLAPLALLATAAFEVIVLRRTPGYHAWLAPLVGIAVVLAAALLLVGLQRRLSLRWSNAALAVALGALLLPPLFWTGTVLGDAGGGILPSAGPRTTAGRFDGAVPPGGDGGPGLRVNPELVSYLEANRGGARFLVATPSSMQADGIIISTGEPVMAMGGFSGGDPILTAQGLATLVENGSVRFFLLPGGAQSTSRPGAQDGPGRLPGGPDATVGPPPDDGGPGGFGTGANNAATRSVIQSCPVVGPSAYGAPAAATAGGFAPGGALRLYDCLGKAETIRGGAAP